MRINTSQIFKWYLDCQQKKKVELEISTGEKQNTEQFKFNEFLF